MYCPYVGIFSGFGLGLGVIVQSLPLVLLQSNVYGFESVMFSAKYKNRLISPPSLGVCVCVHVCLCTPSIEISTYWRSPLLK